ncbi:MAG: cytochrome c [Chloroflexi bacterium]|nr:cytochrome c [Chloroflexota bacterium]
MIANGFALLVLIAVAVLLFWLARRAWRARHAYVKWPGVALFGLLGLLLTLLSVAGVKGMIQFYSPGGSPVPNIKVAGTPEQIARGQHLANSLCVGCHSPNDELPLTGGRDIGADSPLPLGHFVSVNLTPAGPLKDWSDGEIMRGLREGIDKYGHPLAVMSTNGVRYLSEDDKLAIIAYLRSQPPAGGQTPDPADDPNVLAAILLGAGVIQLEQPATSAIVAPARAASVEYGKYVVDYEDCRTCHGKDLTGGTDPTSPPGPSLRVVQGWTRDQFFATIRTGKDPGGHQLNDIMPWRLFSRLDDDELGAVYAYLKSLPPVATQ